MTMMTPNTLVKWLDVDRMPAHGGSGQWPEPGEWREVDGDLAPCVNGLHVCTLAQSMNWLTAECWLVEIDGDRIEEPDKLVVRRARLTERVEAWNDRTARLFAADCAEHVLPLYEQQYPGDDRPRRCIAATRGYANGSVTRATWDAAWAAAEAAARAAAQAVAWAAARAVAWAAEDAAWAAAEAAARAAAQTAAWAAALAGAGAAERAWQTERLLAYLGGEVG